jgi:thiamine-monophosphate kinase
MDELSLIERIRRRLPSAATASLSTGIGDDAAVLRPRRGVEWVITTDGFLENVHFLANAHPPEVVGYKALARAASDIAAMGARPLYFFLTLGLPTHRLGEWLDKMLDGMGRLARRHRMRLAGGDTLRNATVVLSLTVLGENAAGRSVVRSGARPGDQVFVSGTLGGAQLGLELVLRGLYKDRAARPLLRPHFHPPLRDRLGARLAARRLATAMIDLSDGLSTDLGHLCRSSGVGARIELARIPAVHVPSAFARHGFVPEELALHGGEDYELLFTVPPQKARRLAPTLAGAKLTCIGEITRGRGLVLVGPGGESPLEPRGWDHFRGR